MNATTNELLGLPYSPWTEKARWALDARRVPYRFRHYQPLIGEPALRLKVKRWTGPVSVPVLTTSDGRVVADSARIARWSDGHGDGPTLFPAEHEAEIERYVALSEKALAAGRALSLERLLADDEALLELVPRPLRGAPLARQVGAFGIRRTMRKYRTGTTDRDGLRAVVAKALDEVKARLDASTAAGGPKTLLGRFTFADIAMLQLLINVEPPRDMKIGTASRRSFVDLVLRERYQGLLAWRDELTEAYRPRA